VCFKRTPARTAAVYRRVMAVTHLFASVPVRDREAAVNWYTQLVGHPPDLWPNDEEAAWRLTDTGWLYVIVDAERAGTALHTLLVDDLDAFITGLAERGIEAEPVELLDGAVRRTLVTDPDGNRVKIGEPLAG
jgi:predicted enzyme related to lactoylglutathione lyase